MSTKKSKKYGDLPPVMQRQGTGSRLVFLAICILAAAFFIADPFDWFTFTPVEHEVYEIHNGQE